MVADGLFMPSGYFYVMANVNIGRCAELFRANVLKMLEQERLIDDPFIKMIKRWRYNFGFSVHNQAGIKPRMNRGQKTCHDLLSEIHSRFPKCTMSKRRARCRTVQK